MTVIRRIAPVPAFKVGLVVYAIVGLIAGILCSMIAFAMGATALHAQMPFMHGVGSILPLIFCPILYGMLGGVLTVISAIIYNVASSWVGGMEVDIK
jgi:hypothetical protein